MKHKICNSQHSSNLCSNGNILACSLYAWAHTHFGAFHAGDTPAILAAVIRRAVSDRRLEVEWRNPFKCTGEEEDERGRQRQRQRRRTDRGSTGSLITKSVIFSSLSSFVCVLKIVKYMILDFDIFENIPVMEKSGDKKKVATKGKSKNNTYR